MRPARDETVAAFYVEELEHGEQVGIALYLVQEHQRVGQVAQRLCMIVAQAHVKVGRGMHVGKHLLTLLVFLEVDFNIMGKHFLPDVPDQVGLPDLSRPVDEEYLVAFLL